MVVKTYDYLSIRKCFSTFVKYKHIIHREKRDSFHYKNLVHENVQILEFLKCFLFWFFRLNLSMTRHRTGDSGFMDIDHINYKCKILSVINCYKQVV